MTPEAPPLGSRIAYYAFGIRLPVRYREWVESDIQKPLFPEIDFLARLAWMTIFLGAIEMLDGTDFSPPGKGFFIILGVILLLQVLPPYRRWIRSSRLRRQQNLWGRVTPPSSDNWREEIGRSGR